MKRDTVKKTGKIVRDTGATVKKPGETGREHGGPTEVQKMITGPCMRLG